jgi:hypothetical protein
MPKDICTLCMKKIPMDQFEGRSGHLRRAHGINYHKDNIRNFFIEIDESGIKPIRSDARE